MNKIKNDERIMKMVVKTQAIFRGLIVRNQVKSIRVMSKKNTNIFRDESNKKFNPMKFSKIVKRKKIRKLKKFYFTKK